MLDKIQMDLSFKVLVFMNGYPTTKIDRKEGNKTLSQWKRR
jgi:hypothetical protein